MTVTTIENAPSRWQRLRYRGPSNDTLFDSYASQRRIDAAAPIVAEHRLLVDAPPTRVWEVLGDPERWPDVDSRIGRVELDGGVVEGARFTWRNGSTRLRSRFAVVDPLHELTWTGSAFGSRVVHRHVLGSTADGGTRLHTEESMSGALVVMLFSSAKLRVALERWLAAIATAVES